MPQLASCLDGVDKTLYLTVLMRIVLPDYGQAGDVMARGLMSDAEWLFFEPSIQRVRARNGRHGSDHRRVLVGVFWIARTGSP
ncbi:hypothetical protein JSE7799_03242 [Jannaschia seosinensis]|uniref:Transposase n=1 Tax=Jannaschia seosinensis TaxID=313367 RepID=A0A0M7BEJ9_9RHOB|nr:hypothetical protein JSE7799_03242 [Jannaschia seosinensis]